jgi:hypothetical protein
MSDTPRTDAFEALPDRPTNWWDFARKLEQENSALRVAGNEMCRILTIPGESNFKHWATEVEIDRAIEAWKSAIDAARKEAKP